MLGANVRSRVVFIFFLAAVLLWNTGIFLTPFFALDGNSEAATFLYNFYDPSCHQWIYRSTCVFENQKNELSVGDCIEHGEESISKITTLYTTSTGEWDGTFVYDRNQIGVNKAEMVEKGGLVGFKFPVSARDMMIYLGMLLGAIVYPFYFKLDSSKSLHPVFYIIALIPMAIDGTGQMFGFWESTNIIRMITGFIAGFPTSIYLLSIAGILLNRKKKKVD